MHPNAQVMKELDERMLANDIDGFMAMFTDDIVMHAGGTSKLAGTHVGKDAFGHVFELFNSAVGEYEFTNHAYLADDEHGVTLQTSTMRRDGKSLSMAEIFVCHFRDGKISELWYLPGDQRALDDWLG